MLYLGSDLPGSYPVDSPVHVGQHGRRQKSRHYPLRQVHQPHQRQMIAKGLLNAYINLKTTPCLLSLNILQFNSWIMVSNQHSDPPFSVHYYTRIYIYFSF